MTRKTLETRDDDGTMTILEIDLEEVAVTVRPATPTSEVPPDRGHPLELESDRYEPRRILGRGGFATVIEAFDLELERVVALKLARRAEHEEDLVHEGRLTAQLQHPNIVAVYDIGAGNSGERFYAMKPLQAESLWSILRRGQDDESSLPPLSRLLEIFRQVCLAVEFAHQAGVIHRDIKPANIVLGAYGEVVLADWGIARRLDEAPEDPDKLAGTISYIAPEQLLDCPHGNVLTDIYALGATLYAVLALEKVRQGTAAEMIRAMTERQPPDRARLDDRGVPDAMVDLCMRTLSYEPADRPSSAQAIATEIEQYLDAQRDEVARQRRTQRLLEEAREQRQRLLEAREAQVRAEDRLATLERHIPDGAPVEDRRGIWEAETALERCRVEEELAFGALVRTYSSVLHDDLSNALARDALAGMYWQRLSAARSARDAIGAARYEQLVRQYDSNGWYVVALDVGGSARIDTPGVDSVGQLYEFVPTGPFLEKVARGEPRPLPARFEGLNGRSYCVEVAADGYAALHVPFVAVAGELVEIERRMYRQEEVPAGFAVITGRGDFALSRFPVKVGEYLDFLNQQARVGLDVEELIPRLGSRVYFELREGGWVMPERDPDGDRWSRRWPMCLVNALMAERYCAHHSHAGRSLRLPTAEEWSWAAAGPDGRLYPWGDGADASLANVRAVSRERGPVDVGTYSTDCSPFGVRDMGGGVTEWTSSWHPSTTDFRVLKGASYSSWAEMAAISVDKLARPHEGFARFGFRPAFSLD